MEGELNKSLSFFEKSVHRTNRKHLRDFKNLHKENKDYSFAIDPAEMKAYGLDETTFFENTFHSKPSDSYMDDNRSLATTNIYLEPIKKASDSLYLEFFEILESYSESTEVLQIIAENARCCSDALNVLKDLKLKQANVNVDEDDWLENERNTWRLLYVLYGNRLNTPIEDEGLTVYCGPSEKYCMLSLFKRETLIRESQLVVDWLECNAAQDDDEVLHFADSTVGWENTIHQLKAKDTIVFESSRPIVDHLHPDAPHMEKKPFHDMDMEDDKKLCKKIFQEIRCGKLTEAQDLCAKCGHSWRSAQLEGWKLFHNPNLEDTFAVEFEENNSNDMETDENKYKDIEGNENRSIWKAMAWKYAEVPSLNKFEKAAVAAYSGNLETLLHVCKTWEDHLWAYMRVMIDVRVEKELRENVNCKYFDLPDQYWDQKMSINDIFVHLEASKNALVQNEALTTDHQIQKYIILDEVDKLVECVADWILEAEVSSQFLRFLSHILMFLEQIGQVHNKEVVEQVLEEYIKRLVEMRQTQLVAFYVSKLNDNMQLHIYSNYLETIIDNTERKESLDYAERCGLNIQAITKQIVENIRRKHDIEFDGDLQHKITSLDEFKISSLDWLLFFDTQLPETLRQTNALISLFLTLRKVDAAQLAFNKLPVDIIQNLTSEAESSPNLKQSIKEYLSYKAYLDAQDAFNVWFKQFKSKPIPPECPSDDALFTEKVAFEHRTSQYEAEIGRWKLTIGQLAKLAKNTLYNLLLFPDGGWLNGAQDGQYLRATFIPECVLLLYNVLYDSEQYEECVQLSDVLASEKYSLYAVYSSEKLGEIFRKFSEASVALLNQKKDPWGHELTA